MVSIQEAISLIDQHTSIGNSKNTLLSKTLGSYLLEDVYAPIDMPPFNQSAMDGYAICYDKLHTNQFTIIDEVKAGDNNTTKLTAGQAVRIFTGAAIPQGSNAVIMQENTSVKDYTLSIKDELKHFKNIRPKGEQINTGEIALKKGTKLNPAAIGYLATLGITMVKVANKPSITIVVTGNELVTPGEPLEFGQIYESNAIMLQTALLAKGFSDIEILKIKDNFDSTKTELKKALDKSNFVLVSGGISVGDYDFVGKALLELETKQVFYKVNQKPGKPLFYGIKNETQIFALPGNPASALTCFYIYIEMALQKYLGNPQYTQTTQEYQLTSSYNKKGIRAEFLKGKVTGNKVTILENQSSAMLNSYAQANVLIYLPEGRYNIAAQEIVKTYAIQ